MKNRICPKCSKKMIKKDEISTSRKGGCPMTLSGKHKFVAVEVVKHFNGTQGYDIIYAIKCIGCGLIDDT